eukprot:scaffold3.g6204.t1
MRIKGGGKHDRRPVTALAAAPTLQRPYEWALMGVTAPLAVAAPPPPEPLPTRKQQHQKQQQAAQQQQQQQQQRVQQRVQQPAPAQPRDPRQLARMRSTASAQSTVSAAAEPAAGEGGAQRKRKHSHVSFAHDLEAGGASLARRASKPRLPAAVPAASRPPLPHPTAVQKEARGALPSAISASALAVPSVMPYALVPAGAPAAQRPVTVLASPWDLVQLRKQLEEDERRRASESVRAQQQAAEDARVVLRVLPGGQAAARGAKGKQQQEQQQQGRVEPAAEAGAGASAQAQRQVARNAGRGSLRATPDGGEDDPLAGLSPGMWHPGLTVVDGVAVVDPLRFAACPLLPPVLVVGAAPRCSQPGSAPAPRPPAFSEDPVRASVEFLHYLAANTCRLPTYGGALQHAVNAEHRMYLERLRRVHFARDGRRMAKERPEGTRRSARTRQAPDAYMPASPTRPARPAGAEAPLSPEDETDVRLGEEFQAELPQARPRPAAPMEREARWLEGLVLAAGSTQPPRYGKEKLVALAAAPPKHRAAAVEQARADLSAALGPAAARALGLGLAGAMGAAYVGTLSQEEEELMHVGFREHGRAFRAVQREFVPTRTVFELINWYYNVTKNKATAQARQWFAEKQQEEQAEVAAQEEAERKAEMERQRRADRQRVTYERRQLREVVGWIKFAACAPKDSSQFFKKPAVVDRALRAAKLVGSLDAQPEGAEPAV